MGFKYVMIPASANDEMQEFGYEDDIVDLTKDTFREHVEKYFAMCSEAVDRSILMEQLKARTGVDLQDKGAKGALSGDVLDRLLSSTSVEIFPVMMPTKETNFNAISMYCDDKGVAKNLEENLRASGLVQAAGFPGQTFRGDVFVGRVYDDTEDEWRRIDFPLTGCSSEADWVLMTQRQRKNRSSGDMSSLAGKMGVKNPAAITPDMLQAQKATGENEQYKWRQTDDEVEVTFKVELQKGDVKLVKVTFARQRLKVVVKGETLIDEGLYGPTHADESTWTLSEGVLQVNLAKAGEDEWPELVVKGK